MIIGYRNVPEYKAKAYNEAGTLTWFPASQRQLGEAVYLTPGALDWPKDEWFCVITALRGRFEFGVPKVWIPEYDDCDNELWYAPEEVIDDYIRGLGLDPRQTVRVSPVSSVSTMQYTLTKEMLNGHGGNLRLTAKCFNNEQDVPKSKVAWEDWEIENRPS